MTTEMLGQAAILLVSALVGAGFGLVYFRLLDRATRALLAADGPAPGRLAAGFAMRLGLAVAVVGIAIAAGAGAAEVLCGLLGFSVVRQRVLARARRGGQG